MKQRLPLLNVMAFIALKLLGRGAYVRAQVCLCHIMPYAGIRGQERGIPETTPYLGRGKQAVP